MTATFGQWSMRWSASSMSSRRTARVAAALLAVAMTGAGCSRAIGGTPVAAPGQTGAALLDTTCGQYVAMDKSSRRDVIVAIGDSGNRLVALGPDAWVDLAVALCTFVKPGSTVAEVLKGAAR